MRVTAWGAAGGILLLAALLLLSGPAAATHGPATTVLLNVQTGASHGCSPDWVSAPDLIARVWVDGRMVAATFKAQDERDAQWFALFDIAAGAAPLTVAIEVLEAEPGPLLFGTSWIVCDVDPGPGDWLNVTVGSAGAPFSGRGDGPRAASVSGYAARATASHPVTTQLRLVSATSASLDFEWDPPAAGSGADEQHLHARPVSRHMRPVGPQPVGAGATSFRLEGLDENVAYGARLARFQGPWRVSAPPAPFRTENLPPPPPDLRASPWIGSANLTWSAGGHDVVGVEIHAAPSPDFTPDASTLRRRSILSSGHDAISGLAGDVPAYVRVVAVDDRGASTPSASVFVLPYPDRAPDPPGTPVVSMLEGVAWVSWDASPEKRLARYEVLLSRDGAATRVVETVPAEAPRRVALRELAPSTSYGVRIRAVALWEAASESPSVPLASPPATLAPWATLNLSRTLLPVGGVLAADPTGSGDPDGDAVRFTLDWGDGTPPVRVEGVATHRYAAPGAYRVLLRVSDGHGGEGQAVREVRVEPGEPPLATLRLSHGRLRVGEPLEADGSASFDPDGSPLRFRIEWGDGHQEEGNATARHAYARPGTYLVRLVVTDRHGEEDARALEVVVGEALPTPASPPTSAPPPSSSSAPAATKSGADVQATTASAPSRPAPETQEKVVPGLAAWALAAAVLGACGLRRR